MTTVAAAKHRERQLLALRSISLEQVHRTALIRYLRDYRIAGTARDQTLREFYGVMDARRAAVAEHRTYLLAASSQLCATDLLELAGDVRAVDLIRKYETTYGQYFSMFCDWSRATQTGASYVLRGLIPEIRANAERLRQRVLAGHLLPSRPISRHIAGTNRRSAARL